MNHVPSIFIYRATAVFPKPLSWQTAILYLIKTLIFSKLLLFWDIIDLFDILIMTKDIINYFYVVYGNKGNIMTCVEQGNIWS